MKKIGLLGGGQLGRMILQSAMNFPVELWTLDPDPKAACADHVHEFVVGSYQDYQTVLDFGRSMDIIGIEIEHVNIEALYALKKEGKTVIPSPEILEIIQDKGLQKQFYDQHQIPTAPYRLIDGVDSASAMGFPIFQKLRKGGYDGKGVEYLSSEQAIQKAFDEPSVLEQPADVLKELAVIVVVNGQGQMKTFPVVEAVFDPQYHLLDYLISPAQIDQTIAQQAIDLAQKTVAAFNGAGIFAVEMFLNKDLSLWVNEIAPRVHNSGHATIESCSVSQFEAYLRILMDMPLPDIHHWGLNALVNVVGEPNHQGEAQCVGLNDIMAMPQTHMHWYGKSITKPGRKMGHITTFDADPNVLDQKVNQIKSAFKIIAK